MQDVYTIRPNLLNTVVASGLMLDATNTRTSTAWLSQFGPIQFTEPPEADRELEIGVTGYGGWGSVTNSPPGRWVRRNVEINDTLTWTSGRHTINAGAEYSPYIVFDSSTKFNQSRHSHILRPDHRKRDRRPSAWEGLHVHAERGQIQANPRQGVFAFWRGHLPRRTRA